MEAEHLDKAEPHKRLAIFLSERLDPANETHNVEGLAKQLGYSHSTTVKMWIKGKAKVPLSQITPIAHFLNIDIAEILPYWLSQECPEDGHLYNAGLRTLSVWEFMLVLVARDVYGAEQD